MECTLPTCHDDYRCEPPYEATYVRIAVDPIGDATKSFIGGLTPLLAILGVGRLEDVSNVIACDILGEMFSVLAISRHSLDVENKVLTQGRLNRVLAHYAGVWQNNQFDILYSYDLASDIIEDVIDFYEQHIDEAIINVKKHGLSNIPIPVDFIVNVNFESLTITILAEINDASYATHDKSRLGR